MPRGRTAIANRNLSRFHLPHLLFDAAPLPGIFVIVCCGRFQVDRSKVSDNNGQRIGSGAYHEEVIDLCSDYEIESTNAPAHESKVEEEGRTSRLGA